MILAKYFVDSQVSDNFFQEMEAQNFNQKLILEHVEDSGLTESQDLVKIYFRESHYSSEFKSLIPDMYYVDSWAVQQKK